MNAFIHQGPNKLIKCDSKDMYNCWDSCHYFERF